jgi:hypothetical protein
VSVRLSCQYQLLLFFDELVKSTISYRGGSLDPRRELLLVCLQEFVQVLSDFVKPSPKHFHLFLFFDFYMSKVQDKGAHARL